MVKFLYVGFFKNFKFFADGAGPTETEILGKLGAGTEGAEGDVDILDEDEEGMPLRNVFSTEVVVWNAHCCFFPIFKII